MLADHQRQRCIWKTREATLVLPQDFFKYQGQNLQCKGTIFPSICMWNLDVIQKTSSAIKNARGTYFCYLYQGELDSIAAKYIRKWLDLPICATLSSTFLPCNKLGLNICPPSVKFSECQTILRTAVKSSPNADIRGLWKDTSNGPNMQYDAYRNTKDVLMSFLCKQEVKLNDHLVSQGYFFSAVVSQALPTLNSVWSSVQGHLPKNIFNFTIKYMNNTLPTKINLCKWGLSSTSDCSFGLKPEYLSHVTGCSAYLNDGRFTWRHNSMLQFIANSFKSVPDSVLYVDLPGFITPSLLSGYSLRPDLLLTISKNASMFWNRLLDLKLICWPMLYVKPNSMKIW